MLIYLHENFYIALENHQFFKNIVVFMPQK